MTFKITGLKEFQKKLEDLERKAKALNGKHEISFFHATIHKLRLDGRID